MKTLSNLINEIVKKYNVIYFIHTFKIGDIVITAISTKDQEISNALRIKMHIIDILYKNWYIL